ncbi:ribosomal RNA small subunit methyltransferase NEP1-like [Cucumis melo var. makuwa]|uniref:Ribosomal RNA small subunit methyltransferase NEP1-like n=1 Tax=Cucumis melo var. makuwa TaxID=1194695 RepID=A0A5D3CRG9_CUCMM|nr:ribosomal RNA small subunit methyltransferase NEP1-like [Cucumis melo var. makuwa]
MPPQKRRNSKSFSSKLARRKQESVENLDELKNVEDVGTTSSLLDMMNEKPQESRVIFVLDNAPLHKGLVGKKWKILDSWRDHQFLLKHKKNLKDFCPENVRQVAFNPVLYNARSVDKDFVEKEANKSLDHSTAS